MFNWKLKKKVREQGDKISDLLGRVKENEYIIKQLTCTHLLEDRVVNNGSWSGVKREYCSKCHFEIQVFPGTKEASCRKAEIDEILLKKEKDNINGRLKIVKENQKELKCEKCPKAKKRLH